jgi:phosphatidate cytidylyltransferase
VCLTRAGYHHITSSCNNLKSDGEKMKTRIITGLILAPLVVLIIWLLPDTLGVALVAAGGLFALDEFDRMLRPDAGRDRLWIFQMVGMLLFVVAGIKSPILAGGLAGGVIFLMMAAFLIERMSRPIDLETAATDVAKSLLGLVWIGIPTFCMVSILSMPMFGREILLTLFCIVWLGDTAAYFGGKYFGDKKLYPALSPKKTMVGGLAGLGGSIIGALIGKFIIEAPIEWAPAILLGLMGGVMEQVGDFAESMLKRGANVKDSGNLIPGHGGMFDRIDGILFAAPVIYFGWFLF